VASATPYIWHKNGRVSEEAQPTSNQKTIVLQKEFYLSSGGIANHPVNRPEARLLSFTKEVQGKTNRNKSNLTPPVSPKINGERLLEFPNSHINPHCRVMRSAALV
jgi:hypothetical protein